MRYLLTFTFLLSVLLPSTVRSQIPQDFSIDVDGTKMSVAEAMRNLQTPGFSYYLDRGDKVGGFQLGHFRTDNAKAVTERTRFQVGSPSAALLCFATLRLVNEGEVDLDAPVNGYLKRWKIPGKDADRITVRDLLLEKIRFGTGYKPDGHPMGEALPNLTELLTGSAAAKNKALRSRGVRAADGNMEYGGWLVLQLLLEDHYGHTLPQVMTDQVLRPLGMEDSFYASELTAEQMTSSAPGHRPNGNPIPGDGYYRYPELGTAGLWSTPRDFTHFVRHLLDAAKGKDNRYLSVELATAGLTPAYGQRSLIFHVDEYGNPFWGGAAKGYYFYTQANRELDYAVVAAANREVVWQLCNQACWRTYDFVKGNPELPVSNQGQKREKRPRLGVFYQEEDAKEFSKLEGEIRTLCAELDVELEFLPAAEGVPAEVTATPAYVLQTANGRSIHAGRHLDPEAVGVFIRTNLLSPRAPEADRRENLLVWERGRQRVAIPLKVTEIQGKTYGYVGTRELAALTQNCLYEVSNHCFNVTEEVSLLPTDRRFYLDLHPYRDADGTYLLSYAVFSQFDCHVPLFDNFGQAVRSNDLKSAVRTLAEAVWQQLESVYLATEAGELPRPLADDVAMVSWAKIGWEIEGSNVPMYRYTGTESVLSYPLLLNQLQPLRPSLPRVQFNFPAPLDRYAGTVDEVTGNLRIGANGRSISGQFSVNIGSLTMGNEGLDAYVIGQALRATDHPSARLQLEEASLPELVAGQSNDVDIPAFFTLKGQRIPVSVQTVLTPRFGTSGQAQLTVRATFTIDILQTFGLQGPDGPADKKNQVTVSANFVATV